MLDEPRRKAVLGDLPQFFETDSVLLRLTFGIEAVTSDGLLRQRSTRSLCEQYIFAEQLRNLLTPGDIAFAISASGNSPNVLRALAFAKASGGTTVGMTGYSGGKMKTLCDYCIVVPSDNMQVIEDFHLSVSHALFTRVCECIRQSTTGLSAAAGSALQSD
jgi:DNA-binding MurR/RpiR family transcriptional regulator